MRKAAMLLTLRNLHFVFTFVLRFYIYILELTNVDLIPESGWAPPEDIKRAC